MMVGFMSSSRWISSMSYWLGRVFALMLIMQTWNYHCATYREQHCFSLLKDPMYRRGVSYSGVLGVDALEQSRLSLIRTSIYSDPDAVLATPIRMSSINNVTRTAPMEVKAGLEVLQIIEIDELRKSFKADIILFLSWYDPLLDVPEAFASLPEGATIDIKELCNGDMCLRFPFFVPDVQFLNLYEVYHPSMPISLMTLAQNGILRKGVKMSGTFTLHGMDLEMFPQDKQWLHFDIESTAYQASNLAITPMVPPITYHPSVFSTVQNAWQVIEDTSALSTVKSWTPYMGVFNSDPLGKHELMSFHFQVMRRSRIRFYRDVLPVYVVLVLIGSTFMLKLEMALDRFNIVLTLLLSLSALMYVTTSGMPQLDTFSRMDLFLIWSFIGTMTAAGVHLIIIYLRMKHVLAARLLNATFFICFLYAATILVILCFIHKHHEFMIAVGVVTSFFGLSMIPTARYIYWRFKRDNQKLGKGDPFDIIFNKKKTANGDHENLTINHLFNEEGKDVGELIKSPSYHGTELRGLKTGGRENESLDAAKESQGKGNPDSIGENSGSQMHSHALRSGALRAYSRPVGGTRSHIRV